EDHHEIEARRGPARQDGLDAIMHAGPRNQDAASVAQAGGQAPLVLLGRQSRDLRIAQPVERAEFRDFHIGRQRSCHIRDDLRTRRLPHRHEGEAEWRCGQLAVWPAGWGSIEPLAMVLYLEYLPVALLFSLWRFR